MAFKKKAHLNTQTEQWLFDEDVLDNCLLKKRHSIFYMPIKTVLREEKCKAKSPFNKQKALRLDKIEIEQAKAENRDQRSTTDMAIGIVRKGGGDKKVRLVECKFDVNNVHRRLIEDLREKNQKTRDYYSFGFPIQELFVVLLNEDFYQQGLRFIKDGFAGSPYCEVLTVKEFYSRYFE